MKLYENGFKLIEQGDTEKLNQKFKQTMKDNLNEVAEDDLLCFSSSACDLLCFSSSACDLFCFPSSACDLLSFMENTYVRQPMCGHAWIHLFFLLLDKWNEHLTVEKSYA